VQLLHRPRAARDPAQIAGAIGGAQAQDTYAGPLSFRARSRSLTAEDITRARTEERSLLRTWVMRMTIHLIPTEDAGWWLPLFEPEIEKWSRRRLGQLGMPSRDAQKAVGAIAEALANEGPLTRPECAERVRAAGIELNEQTRLHVVGLAVTSGLACLGPDRGRSTCLVRREDWLGKLPRFDRERALARLARRYLGAFAPATDRDFAYWAGLPLREVRAGLDSIAKEIEQVQVGEQRMLALRRSLPRLPARGQVRLLANFDTYLLGWKKRDFAVATAHAEHVKEGGGGWIRPVVVEDGVVVGGWRSSRRGGRVEVSLRLPKAERERLAEPIDAEIADVARFEGMDVKVIA